jgi:hypothetical protein
MDGLQFLFATPGQDRTGVAPSVERVTLEAPLFHWLREQLRTSAWPMNAAAARQPVSVHELTETLYEPFRVDGGHAHLAGCNLEDRPFLRLSYLDTMAGPERPQLTHVFATEDGRPLDEATRRALELDMSTPVTGRPPRLDNTVLQRWVEVTRQHSEQDNLRSSSLIAVTLVWCKYVEAKLAFSIGQATVELAFAGWARFFGDRSIRPPPYSCPLCGKSSYHLAATDRGQVTVAEAISRCAVSGRRVLDNELETCTVTGSLALPDFMQVCPVAGEKVLRSVLEPCSWCQQRVSPQVVVKGRCAACRHLEPIARQDPCLARVLAQYPELECWRSWRMSETRTAYVLIGTSLWKRLLLVLDKSTLQVHHLGTAGRFSNHWTAIPLAERERWLR